MAKKPAAKKDTSPHVHQNAKIAFDLSIREFPWTQRQQEVVDASLKHKAAMTIVDGIWGSGKTLIALYACLKLLQEKKISNILYIRNVVQSGSGTLGWLGGDLQTKLCPFMLPLQQKLDELLPPSQVSKLINDKVVETQPVALLRGTSYNCYGIIIDEAGCMTKEDLMLTLSRVGVHSRVYLIGDSWQVDVPNSGFREVFDKLNDEESRENKIYAFELQEELDCVRSPFLRYVLGKMRR